MRIVEQSVEIVMYEGINGYDIIEHLEKVGRTCYRSEDKITDQSAEKFIRGIVKSGHTSILEHASLTVKFITSRDVTHQIVRHRTGCSYAQESQRYVNYTSERFGKEVVFIKPVYFISEPDTEYDLWLTSCERAEEYYFILADDMGRTAEEARAVLPNCTKTELMMTATLTAWRHFFEVRCDHHAQLPIRLLAIDLLKQMTNLIPVVFDDLYLKFVGEDIVK